METSGPPVVWTREQVAEEGEGGGSRTIIFTCLTHVNRANVYLPLIFVICIASLLNGVRLQSMIDPLRRDASPLNVEVILYIIGLFSSGVTLLTCTCTPDVRRLGEISRFSGKGCIGS